MRALWARSNTTIPYITLVITSLAVERAAARHQPFHREDGFCVRLNFSFWLGAKTEGGGPGEAELAHPASGRALGHRCGATLQSQSRGAERLRSCARASAFAAAAARWDAKSSPDGATAARCSEGPC